MYVVGSASDPTIPSGLDELALLAGTGAPLKTMDARSSATRSRCAQR
jgi:hypothetical protein